MYYYPYHAIKLFLLILLLGLMLPNCQRNRGKGEYHFKLATSEKLDAATFLNTISSNPRFNSAFRELGVEWQTKIAVDSLLNTAFERWSGRGIQLAYLLSAIPENSLEATLHRFRNPEALLQEIEAGLDEPAYRSIFKDLKTHHKDIYRLFSFFQSNGFCELRRDEFGVQLEQNRTYLQEKLAEIDQQQFGSMLEMFTGRDIPRKEMHIYVLIFAKPYSFQLSGFAIGWASQTEYFDWLLAHEFLHKFNPDVKNLNYLHRLAENDSFYAETFERIYTEFNEGKEEEFVEAAARYMTVKMGRVTPIRNLRQLKFRYYSPSSNSYGMPLATILMDTLLHIPAYPGDFDYNAFISAVFRTDRLRPGILERYYIAAIESVSGTAGMILAMDKEGCRITRVLEKFPAAEAGLRPQDRIIAIDTTIVSDLDRETILDLMAGPSGAEKNITILRQQDTLHIRLHLR